MTTGMIFILIFTVVIVGVLIWISVDPELAERDAMAEFERDIEELEYELLVERQARERLEKLNRIKSYGSEL